MKQITYSKIAENAVVTNLEDMFNRLKDEHKEFFQEAVKIEADVDQVDRFPDYLEAADQLRAIKRRLTTYMNALDKHALWEEEELIPLIDHYFQRPHTPTITSSIWVMEKDYELATDFLRASLQRIDQFGPHPNSGVVADAIRCLLQGIRLLKEHLSIEEQTVMPLVEEMLVDMDSLFS